MKKNGIALLALLLCLLSLALTALVWLNTEQVLDNQNAKLTALQEEIRALKDQLDGARAPGSELKLAEYRLEARAWADGTGADVTLTALPEAASQGLEVTFRAGTPDGAGAEALCQWDGTGYTATLSLSARNGYSYDLEFGGDGWLCLASPEGTQAMECVYLADSLSGYLTFELESWAAAEGILTIHRGFGLAQLPLFDTNGSPVTARSCEFSLRLEDEILGTAPAQPVTGEAEGSLEILAQELTFPLPELGEGQQAELWLELELSNGQPLTVFCGGWTLADGQLGQVAG